MPQMAPISWLFLFITFSITFLIFNVMNYYSFTPSTPKYFINKKKNFSLNWKW